MEGVNERIRRTAHRVGTESIRVRRTNRREKVSGQHDGVGQNQPDSSEYRFDLQGVQRQPGMAAERHRGNVPCRKARIVWMPGLRQYDLTPLEREIFENYCKLSKAQRLAFWDVMQKIIGSSAQSGSAEASPPGSRG